jgi:hypothetical protein
MDEDTFNKWKFAFKWISIMLALAGASGTVYKYLEDRKVEAEQREEARRKDQNSIVYQHQADLYFETAQAAASIATALDPKARDAKAINAKILKDARERFAQLFWGELAPIEDRRVELATIAFQRCLLNNGKACQRVDVDQHGNIIEAAKLSANGDPDLQNLSLEVGACIRSAFQEDRKVTFSPSASDQLKEKLKAQSIPAITTCPYD